MNIYEILIQLAELAGAPVKYAFVPGLPALRMAEHASPVSITLNEYEFIKNFVERHELKCGYEVATGFGISALAAGLGFRRSGGKLVTLDAYLEEKHGSWDAYKGSGREVYRDADGYKSAAFLMEQHGLQSQVALRAGWSPDDVAVILREEFPNGELLDYVFIDGGHWEDAFLKDLRAVFPFMRKDRYALFIHDWHAFQDSKTVAAMLREYFGKLPQPAFNCHLPAGFNLVYVTDLS